MPGRIIDRDDDVGLYTRRISARNILQVRGKRHLQALLFVLTSFRCAARRLLQQAGRQLPRHDIERSHTIDLVLVIPCADDGAMALHAQRSP
jgi:hypothetical protein